MLSSDQNANGMNERNDIVVVLGNGRVLITSGTISDTGSTFISFQALCTQHKIGVMPKDEEPDIVKFAPSVCIEIQNKEGLNELARAVERCRKLFDEGKTVV